jgi:soluble lytic murein transglycosylase-like protein
MGLSSLFLSLTLHFNLPHGLLESICYTESKFNVNAVHHDDGDSDSLGLCQVKLKTARFMGFKGNAKKLMNPQINSYYAAKYLKYQISRYHSVRKAVIAYNMGSTKGLTTTKYQTRVFKYWRMHKQ